MKNEPDIVAKLDQALTGLTNLASMLGEYYLALIKSGIPDDLARELVIEAHNHVLSSQKGGS